METDLTRLRKVISKDLVNVYVQFALLLALAWFCIEIFSPFIGLFLWSLILAVSFYPLHQWLSKKLHNSEAKSAVVLVVVTCFLVGAPTIMLGVSLAEHLREWVVILSTQSLVIPEPNPVVSEWPVIGPIVFEVWGRVYSDLGSALKMVQPQIMVSAKVLVGAAANTLLALASFFVALLIAGFMMARSATGIQQLKSCLNAITDREKGEELQVLATATIRSVANGVVGVAFLQALAVGLGFLAIEVPAAGFLSFLILCLGVLQLPSSIVIFPVIVWLWWLGDTSLLMNIVATVYLLGAGFADSILKPYFLGRGVQTPMPIVLIGALGGMVAQGLIGLFVGSVVLSVAYKLLMSWVEHRAKELPIPINGPSPEEQD